MKAYSILIALLLGCCLYAAPAEPASDSDIISAPVPISVMPDYLMDVYDGDVYHSTITVSCDSLSAAPIIYVEQTAARQPASPYKMYFRQDMKTPFLAYGDKKFDAFLKDLKLLKQDTVRGEFQYARYDITGLIGRPLTDMYDYNLVVLSRKGKRIGYWMEAAVGGCNFGKPDVVLLEDGRYLAANANVATFFETKNGRIISEQYFDWGVGSIGSKNVGPLGADNIPVITIINENVVKAVRKDGSVEYRKLRLSDADLEQNAAKSRAHNESGALPRMADDSLGIRHVFWWNGQGKHNENSEMWCFRRGGSEPSQQECGAMLEPRARFTVSEAAKPAAPAAERRPAQTGLLARLYAGIKSLFAGLFA